MTDIQGMFAVNSVQRKTQAALMLKFRNDLLLKDEWRKRMISRLTSFLTKNKSLFEINK